MKGDIVDTYHKQYNEQTRKVDEMEKFEDGRGVIVYSQEEARFRVETKSNFSPVFGSNRFFEVIGNIYETPELLNP